MLRYIDAIALTGSLSKAAKLLQIDASTLSRHLQKIETQHGFRIFKRNGNSYAVTPAGTPWVSCAQEIRAKLDDLMFSQGGKVPAIVVTSLEIFLNHYLIPRISELPGKLEFIGADRSLDLPRREADVAIRFGKPESGDLIAQKLCVVGHAIYARKDFQPNARTFKTQRWATLNDAFAAIEDVRWFHEHIGDDAIAYKTSSCEQIIALLQEGHLLAVLPCYMADKNPRLHRVGDGKTIFQRTAWLVFHRDLASKRHVRAFVEQVKNIVERDAALLLG